MTVKYRTNNMGKTNWPLIIIGLVFLLLVSFILAGILALFTGVDLESATGNIALISITGVITSEKDESAIFEGSSSSSEIVELIEKADKNPNIKGIILEINSPGGSPVASDEIAQAIKETNKTTVALIREVGASGAYWIASSTEHIIANKMSITGSIGVFASYLEFAGLINEYNVTYQRLVSGRYKDIGSPLKELTQEERRILQEKIDKLYKFFIEEVSKNRNLPKSKVEELSTGIFYLGSEAIEVGLVDELGTKKQAISYIERKEGIIADVVEYKKEKTLLDVLGRLMNEKSFYIGKGIGSALTNLRANQIFKITT